MPKVKLPFDAIAPHRSHVVQQIKGSYTPLVKIRFQLDLCMGKLLLDSDNKLKPE